MSKKVKKWQKVFRQESCRTVSGWPDDIDNFFAALENGSDLRKPTREKMLLKIITIIEVL
jgi:hypothetical protein